MRTTPGSSRTRSEAMNNQSLLWLALGAALSLWLSTVAGGVSILVVPAFISVAGWLAWRHCWRPLFVLLITSPFAVASGFAVISYARGTAHLQTVGLPGPDLYNVSPTTRYQTVSSGCVVNGSEWVFNVPNNLTLLALRAALGPMPGAYDGPFPGRDDIAIALRDSSKLSWEDLEQDQVTTQRQVFRLRTSVGSQLASALSGSKSQDSCCQPSVSLWRQRVLLLQFPSRFSELDTAEPLVVIIDGETGKIVAYQGQLPVYTRALPRQWT